MEGDGGGSELFGAGVVILVQNERYYKEYNERY